MDYFIDISQPFGDIVEALGVSDVIDQHNTHRSPVITGGYCVKPIRQKQTYDQSYDYCHYLFA